MSEPRCTRCDLFGSQEGAGCECSRRTTRVVYGALWTSHRPLIVLGLLWLLVNLLAEVLC